MPISMQYSTTVDEFAEPAPTLQDYLNKYGYVLAQPNGYLMLKGFLSGSYLEYARKVIEAKYPPKPGTTPALVEVVRSRRPKRQPAKAKQPNRRPAQKPKAKQPRHRAA